MLIVCNGCSAQQHLPTIPREQAAHCHACGALLARSGVGGTTAAVSAGLVGLVLIAIVLSLPWWEVSLAGGGSLAFGIAEIVGTAPGLAVLLLLGLSALQLLLASGGLLAGPHPLGAASLRVAALLRPAMTTGLLLLAALLPLLLSWLGVLPLTITAGPGIWALVALVACAHLTNMGLDEPAALRAMGGTVAWRGRGPRHLVTALPWTLLLLITGCAVLLWMTPVLQAPASLSLLGAAMSPLAQTAGMLISAGLAILVLILLLLSTMQVLSIIRHPACRGRNLGGGLFVRLMLLPALLLLLPLAVVAHFGQLPNARLPLLWPLLGLGLTALALRALCQRFLPRYTEVTS